jgi:UDP-GlcNAc:undecaprenyl-phosphate GlcNAc-1-phosphate transferase
VSVVRHFSGRAISQGGRDHLSHRLVAVGLSEARAVLVLWAVSIVAGLDALVLYKIGFSYSAFVAALVFLGFVLTAIVLVRVRVYGDDETVQPTSAAQKPGFVLLADFRYKRQVLWVLVDAATIVLSIYGTYLMFFGGGPEWASQTLRFARVTPLAVASILLGLLVTGLYRSDWQGLSSRELVSVAVGVTAGFVATLVLFQWGPFDADDNPVTLMAAWIATIVAMLATRVFVNVLDGILQAAAQSHFRKQILAGTLKNEESRVV